MINLVRHSMSIIFLGVTEDQDVWFLSVIFKLIAIFLRIKQRSPSVPMWLKPMTFLSILPWFFSLLFTIVPHKKYIHYIPVTIPIHLNTNYCKSIYTRTRQWLGKWIMQRPNDQLLARTSLFVYANDTYISIRQAQNKRCTDNVVFFIK